jgi:hypothetical protein
MAAGTTMGLLLCLACLALAADDWYQFGNNHRSLREFLKRQSECVPQCVSAPVPELCRAECIHPSCAARAKASGLFEDSTDTAHAHFHAAFRQCAETEFAQAMKQDM